MLGTVALPAAAHAIAACTAAQIISQDSASCPNNSNPCNISKTFEIGDGCTLDFGTRNVTVLGSGKIDVLSNSVNIRAGTFSVAPGGRVEGRGNLTIPPRDRGGSLTITTTGAVNIQRSGSFRGVVDFSGNTRGGTFNVVAGGSITVSGDIIANNLTQNGGNGVISLRSGVDITTGSLATIAATGGFFSSGGFIDFTAPNGMVDLGASVSATGGDGGVVDIFSGGEAIVRGINSTGGGDAGSGGCASVFAGTRVQMLGPVVLNGTGSPTLSGGGCGGFIDIEARFGDATISSPITAESGAPDGGGGGISVIARGSIVQAAAAPLSVQGQGPASCGGEIALEADLDVTASGNMNASGGFGGNLVDLIAGRNIALNGMVDARGRDTGGFGGSATIIAGDRGFGNVAISSTVDVGGGLCGTINGCGLGGFTEISGCNVTIASTAVVTADGADGGDNLLVAREKLTVQGLVDATTSSGMTNGTNTFQFPTRVAPTIVTANVTPPPVLQSLATCTAVGQTGCLNPCPTCGNGMVEFPEQCDGGNTANCDGCSNFCRTQNCNDGSACTSDSCDATLGCRTLAVSDGTSCTDNNVCNGVEQCTAGVCRASTPPLNCNDNNQCTTDACNPTLGCQNPASPINTPCNDGNICTGPDVCNGNKVCSGPPSCGTTTTTTIPVPTTSTTAPVPTTTSTTAPIATTTSTTAPIPTTTSTTAPVPTTTSTTAPVPTTTSTTAPIATTTSTTAPIPTTTSTTSPVPTTTSTTAPVPTTTSTTSPVPTTTSTTVPGATTSTSVSPATTTSTSVPGATTSSTSLPAPTTTSTTTPAATTTSTSAPRPSTTSTTLPTGCVPANCSDGNDCTTDVCQAGICVHRREGFDAVACELAKLTAGDLCGADPVDQKLAKAFVIRGTLVRNFVGRAENNTKRGQTLLSRALKQLNVLRNKVARVADRGKISPSCRSTLESLLAERVALVQGLSTP